MGRAMTVSWGVDKRVVELEQLAHEENITLPYPADYIVWLEDHGRMVDLNSGDVIYAKLVAVPTTSAEAVAYLLAGIAGEVAI